MERCGLVVSVILFSCCDGYIEDVLFRWKRTGSVRCKGAGRIISFIEINGSQAIGTWFFYGKESSGRVGGLTIRGVGKYDKKFVAFFQCIQGVLFIPDSKEQLARCLLLA